LLGRPARPLRAAPRAGPSHRDRLGGRPRVARRWRMQTMGQRWTIDDFEVHRAHLRGIAYRMLGSLSEADDAVQVTWLRLQRTDADQIENLVAWCTTVVTRVCLNQLRSRSNRKEDALGIRIPDPVVTAVDQRTPEDDAVTAESVGLALLVVLETLSP